MFEFKPLCKYLIWSSYILTAEDISVEREEEERRRHEIIKTFRTAPFEEIVARSEAKVPLCSFTFVLFLYGLVVCEIYSHWP